MMNTIIVALVGALLAFLAMCFYCWSINPAEWSPDCRFCALMLMFASSVILVSIQKGEYI